MHELVVTRHNELVDPVLSVWSWQIPVYLFLGGWVAGIMVIGGYFLLKRRDREPSCVCSVLPALSVVALSLGMLALFLDLEHKPYVWRLYTTFQITSPMSWGAWVLLAVYPALAAAWLVSAPALLRDLWPALDRWYRAVKENERTVHAIGGVNIALGALLGVYTGVLLSSLGARPFWNSALLGPLFLLSGLSSAAAFTHLVARNPDERVLLARADNHFLAAELAVIALFLIGLTNGSQAQIDAAGLVLGGPYTAVFWVGVIALGVVIPLGIQVMAVSHRIAHQPLAPIFVMAGGLLLRFVFVYAGQFSRWRM
jgi:protein NrfD